MPSVKAQVHFDRALTQMHDQEWDAAIDMFKLALEEDAQYSEASYNLACCYSILKRKEDALIYLDRAIKLDTACMDWAKTDEEFSPLWNDPDFKDVLVRNDPLHKPSLGKDGAIEDSEEPPVMISSRQDASPESAFPPCIKCGQVVQEKSVGLVGFPVALFILLSGLVCIFLYFSLVGFTCGVAMILCGLYLSANRVDALICTSCQAVNPMPGLAANKPKPVSALERQAAQEVSDTGGPEVPAGPDALNTELHEIQAEIDREAAQEDPYPPDGSGLADIAVQDHETTESQM